MVMEAEIEMPTPDWHVVLLREIEADKDGKIHYSTEPCPVIAGGFCDRTGARGLYLEEDVRCHRDGKCLVVVDLSKYRK